MDSAKPAATIRKSLPQPEKIMTLDAVLDRIDETLPQSLDRLMDLLRIPSISTDPAYKADCARTADLLAADLASLGFDARAARHLLPQQQHLRLKDLRQPSTQHPNPHQRR